MKQKHDELAGSYRPKAAIRDWSNPGEKKPADAGS
jgi:hypothetical protein